MTTTQITVIYSALLFQTALTATVFYGLYTKDAKIERFAIPMVLFCIILLVEIMTLGVNVVDLIIKTWNI